MKTDREICAAANAIKIQRLPFPDVEIDIFRVHFSPQKITQMLDRQEQLESKLKEASELIQCLTIDYDIDYDIISEIEGMLSE